MTSQRAFKIIIVGGGVAGLTLANMLEKFDIDYVILEAHGEIAPPVGASLGLMPDGLLLLDQIGCYEAVRAKAANYNIETSHIRNSDGKSMSCTKGFMGHIESRHFYPMLFFDRQWLLQVLYGQLQHKKDRVLLHSRVKTVVPLEGAVSVVTTDGRTLTGDVVVGADGIHSVIRHEMRRLMMADEIRPGFVPEEEERIPCYYRCLFGISVGVQNWPDDEQTFTNGRGVSFLAVSGPAKRVYWFCFARLAEKKCGKEIPRYYTKEDEARFMEEHGHRAITESVTFGDIYAKRISSTLTPLHEVVFEKWGFERIVLVGDSAHKPNPISGVGGNAAIETAAEFVNVLLRARDKRRDGLLSGLSTSDVETISQEMQKARIRRVKGLVKTAHAMQALFAYERPFVSSIFHTILLPLLGPGFSLEQLSSRFVGGPRLQHLPVPVRPHAIPFKHELPAKPLGRRFVKYARMVFVLLMAFVLLIPLAKTTAFPNRPESPKPTCPPGGDCLGAVAWVTTSKMAQTAFAGFIMYGVECFRIGHQGTLLRVYPVLVAVMLLLGIDMDNKAVSLFAILSAYQSSLRPSGRPIDPHILKMALSISMNPTFLRLAFVVVHMLPIIACLLWPGGSLWKSWLESVPLGITTALLFLLGWRCLLDHNSEPEATDGPKRFDQYKDGDAPQLRAAYSYFFTMQAGAHIAAVAYFYLYASGQRDLWSSIQSVLEALPPSAWIGMAGHCLYSVWELRRLGFVTTREAAQAALAVILGQALVGSGAVWAATWVWREAAIAKMSTLNRPPLESSRHVGGEIKAHPS
ncbi:FAD binding domain protein [Podospora didyma]|uniref:FAD binding domain protein n=1 Tax=Podospora didyma TaxID=330526 RepID=A0AAE0K5Q4_9PEZI|nr:FAD binding domain protein [Podospora didyma]